MRNTQTAAARPTTPPATPERRHYTAAELISAYGEGDGKAQVPTPLLRERRLAWHLAKYSFDFSRGLPKRQSPLHARIAVERDFLEAHLKLNRTEMPERIIAEFQDAIDTLTSAVNVLEADRHRRARSFSRA